MSVGVLVVNAEIGGRPGLAVRVRGGLVSEVGPGLRGQPGEPVLDAGGGAVIPGLHDHHLHLRSAVASRTSLRLDPATVVAAGGFAAALRSAATAAPTGEWMRGIGAHGGEVERLDRWALDAIVADRPVRLQHRSGALWLLNSAAVIALGVGRWSAAGVERLADGTPTGRLWRLDERVRDAASDAAASQAAGLAKLSGDALRLGITGFTDATAGRSRADVLDLDEQVRAGRIRQRLTLLADPELRELEPAGVRLGARKIVLDDQSLPAEDELAALFAATHKRGCPVAVHCVSAEQLVLAVGAFRCAGSQVGDRIEHAGIVPPGFSRSLAKLGITVVTQPGFLSARGDDYLRDVPPAELGWLYPCGTLLAAGVLVGAGSDAPFGPLDPWLAMATAVERRSRAGAAIGLPERIDPASALRLYLGRADSPGEPRRVAAGEPGELCVLRAPIDRVLSELGSDQVAAVVIGDEIVEVAGND